MKITLILIGKTEEAYLNEGFDIYHNRLKHYVPFEVKLIPAIKNTKNMTVAQQKLAEAALLQKVISPTDYVVLLDETGKQFTSPAFATFLDKQANTTNSLLLIVGGPYGVDESIKKRANYMLSLSNMTFSHQMVRLFIIEQLYRAYTILKGEPYHHV
jgi:23S rRNA (pseudouridine1915-N3)-methyltransferase